MYSCQLFYNDKSPSQCLSWMTICHSTSRWLGTKKLLKDFNAFSYYTIEKKPKMGNFLSLSLSSSSFWLKKFFFLKRKSYAPPTWNVFEGVAWGKSRFDDTLFVDAIFTFYSQRRKWEELRKRRRRKMDAAALADFASSTSQHSDRESVCVRKKEMGWWSLCACACV